MLSDHCLDPFKMFQTAQVNNSRKAGGKQSVGFRLFGVASATSPSAASQFAASRKVADPVAAAGRLIAILAGLCALTGCGGSGGTMPTASLTNVGVAVSPGTVSIQPEGSQQFVAAVTGASNGNVTWSVSLGGSSGIGAATALDPGLINAAGVYVAPPNVAATATVAVTASSVANPNATAAATVTVNPSTIVVAPATVTLKAGATQAFTAIPTGLSPTSLQWMVNGQVGGGPTWGTVSQQGIYTAPAIDPGAMVTVSAASTANGSITGNAGVTVVNPPTPPLAGATYAQTLDSWNTVLLPWAEDLSGLTWDPNGRAWNLTPNWPVPTTGISPQIYYLEMALRPATRMAIARQDIPLMEELAEFHVALLNNRATTIGAMLQNAPNDAVITIGGLPTDRTFPWYYPYSIATRTVVTEDVQANVQYLSTAAQLLRAITEMPAANRTAPMTDFVQDFSGFLVSEQLLRLLYNLDNSEPWSYYQNPNIPQPVVSAWIFLAATGYRPPPPLEYEAKMTDMELWLVADSAEVLGADAAAPELAILNDYTRAQLQQAVLAGVGLMQARCHHLVSPDGADVLSAFAGDNDGHPDLAYSGDTGPEVPTVPNPKYGLSWDMDHAYRFPIVFRSLYETRSATGAPFPTLNDLVALGNTYVHLAFNGNSPLPAFNNFLDGWNGWDDVGGSIPDGYPPYQYCNAMQTPINCLIAGSVQGWGQLAFANPDLATLYQNLVNLAYDDSPDTLAFKNQHYYYHGPYSIDADSYPWLMIYVAGDSAERLP